MYLTQHLGFSLCLPFPYRKRAQTNSNGEFDTLSQGRRGPDFVLPIRPVQEAADLFQLSLTMTGQLLYYL